MDKTKKEALEKFFGFCELFPGNTATLKADASGLLYLPEAVNGNTNTTIFLCFTDKAGRVQDNRTFVIDTFNKLDLSDTRKFTKDTQKEASDFQKIITIIFESSLIELDSPQYAKMLEKMIQDSHNLQTHYTAFENARSRNDEAMNRLTEQYNKSRVNAYDNIVNNVISQYNNSFLTSLKHLNETKILVDDWRGKIAVKLENRREAIRRFQANIQKYDTSLPIVMRTLESCDKSLANVQKIIEMYGIYNHNQGVFTAQRVYKSRVSFRSLTAAVKHTKLPLPKPTELMLQVDKQVGEFIGKFKTTIENVKKTEVAKIKATAIFETEKNNKSIGTLEEQLKQLNKQTQHKKLNTNNINGKIKTIKIQLNKLRASNRKHKKKIDDHGTVIAHRDDINNKALASLNRSLTTNIENLITLLDVENETVNGLERRTTFNQSLASAIFIKSPQTQVKLNKDIFKKNNKINKGSKGKNPKKKGKGKGKGNGKGKGKKGKGKEPWDPEDDEDNDEEEGEDDDDAGNGKGDGTSIKNKHQDIGAPSGSQSNSKKPKPGPSTP